MQPTSGRAAVARLASPGANPYFDLLERGLAACGLTIVPDPPFTLRWLWQSRREIAVLHFHWRIDRYYIWQRRTQAGHFRPSRFQRALTWLTLAHFVGRVLAARVLSYRLAWTVHEALPPETRRRQPGSVSRRVDRIAARLLARWAVLLAHDHAVAEAIRSELRSPALRIELVPHGSYIGVYPPGRVRSEVRAALHIDDDAFVFLCFGALRPEKQIPLLVRAFEQRALEDSVLVVAGAPDDDAAVASTLRAARADARIVPLLEAIQDERVAELYGAADAAVLARSEPWTSGSLILAMSLGVPVVAAQLPLHEHLLDDERAGWLFRPGEVESLSETLDRAAGDRDAALAKGVAARRNAENLPSWDEIARLTASHLLRTDPAHGLIRVGKV